MKIKDEIITEIVECMPCVPPEAGGIIGGREGAVCLWQYDAGYFERGCVYSPNVEFLNKVIADWADQGCDFMGVFHVHFGGAKDLSDGDKKYIERILRAMPDFIKKLYFPIIVQPEKKFVSYVAYRKGQGHVEIEKDEVEIFSEKGMKLHE